MHQRTRSRLSELLALWSEAGLSEEGNICHHLIMRRRSRLSSKRSRGTITVKAQLVMARCQVCDLTTIIYSSITDLPMTLVGQIPVCAY
ncbi:hypothetical protein BDW67DRAFT_166677 [Aspergillus spinulosporus]